MKWTQHSNQLGDWCPWSACSAPADRDDDQCPAGCPASSVEEEDVPAEPSGPVEDRDGDVWHPHPLGGWWLPPQGEPREWSEVVHLFGPLEANPDRCSGCGAHLSEPHEHGCPLDHEARGADFKMGDGPGRALLDTFGPERMGAVPVPDPAARWVLGITREQLREWSGRDLSDDDIERLAECIGNSSIPEAIGTIASTL